MRRALLWIVLVLPVTAGCDGEPGGTTEVPEGDVTFSRLVPDSLRSTYGREENRLIQDAKTWAAVWAELSKDMVPAPSPPAVDFHRHMVLAAFLGPRVGRPATVSIGSVERVGDRLVVTVAVRQLTSSASTQRASPYSIVTVARTSLPVEWKVVQTGRGAAGRGTGDGDGR